MPDEYKIAPIDLNRYKRLVANLPSHIKEEQRIPTYKEKDRIINLIKYNAIWLILTYGADLISYVSPLFGKAFKALVSWKFEGGWEQKEIGLK